MKLVHHEESERVLVQIKGDVEASRCDCLSSFWNKRLQGDTRPLTIMMDDVDAIDAESIAVLTSLVRKELGRGRPIEIHAAPQMLAHTLYKVASLRDGSGVLTLVEPREEGGYIG